MKQKITTDENRRITRSVSRKSTPISKQPANEVKVASRPNLKKVAQIVKRAKREKHKKEEPKENAIFALNDDCLIEVFRYLNIHDLVSVVSVSPRFRHSACKAFGLQYRKQVLSIFFRPGHTNFVLRLDGFGLFGTYSLRGMKQFFRNFGPAVGVLEIEQHRRFESNVINSLFQSISKHCSNIADLRIDKCKLTPKILSKLEPLQETLTRLELSACSLGDLPNLHDILSTLTILKLIDVSNVGEIIQHAFPNLVDFSICNSHTLKDEHLIGFVEQNAQLTTFGVRCCRHITHNIFVPIATHLTALLDLHIQFDKNSHSGTFDQYPLNVRNLQKLALVGFRHLSTYLDKMAPQNENLRAIELHDRIMDDQMANVINCISSYKRVNVLEFYETPINRKNLMQIAKNAPQLVELMLNSNSTEMDFDFDALIRLTERCKHLTTLKLNTNRAKILKFNCETLYRFVTTVEKRTDGAARKINIYSRNSIDVQVPKDHFVVYRDRLKLVTRM